MNAGRSDHDKGVCVKIKLSSVIVDNEAVFNDTCGNLIQIYQPGYEDLS